MKYHIFDLAFAKGTSEPVRQALIAQAEEIEGLKLEVSAQMDKVDELWQQKFWFARDLMEPLDYARRENFVTAINRAIESCKTTGYDAEDHFRDATKMIELANGAKRQVDDFMLTRYACYLERAEGTLAIVHRANEYLLKFIGERNAEIELLKQRNAELDNKICELNRLIAKQARVALKAIDDAKKHASYMLKLAQEKEKALNPALLESEREANAILTNRVQELEQSLRDAPEDAEIGRFLLRHATEWTRKPYISDYENEAPYAVMGLRVPYDTDLSSIGMRRYAVQQAMKALEQKKC